MQLILIRTIRREIICAFLNIAHYGIILLHIYHFSINLFLWRICWNSGGKGLGEHS
jgi:hypothetical protein